MGPSQISASAVCYLPFYCSRKTQDPVVAGSVLRYPFASVLHPLLWFGVGTPSCCSGLALERSKIMKVLRHQRQDFPKCILMHLGAYTYELGGLFWDIITFSFEVLRRDRLDPVCDSALDPDVFKTFFIWLLYLVDDTSNRCT